MEPAIQSFSNSPTAIENNKNRIWTCEVCSQAMEETRKQSHLTGKKHLTKVQKIKQQSEGKDPLSVVGNSVEIEPPKTRALPQEEITDPVKQSYLRMKERMGMYGSFQTKTINFRASAEVKDAFAYNTKTVESEIVLENEEEDGGTNDLVSANTPAPLRLRRGVGRAVGLQLDLDTPSGAPAAALASLKAARRIKNFKDLNYPADVQSPGLSQHPVGDYKYKKEFLMQFENVFTEKPCVNWDDKVINLFGDGAPLPPDTRVSLGLPAIPVKKSSREPSKPGSRPRISMQNRGPLKTAHEPETGAKDNHSRVDISPKGLGGLGGFRRDLEAKQPRTDNRSSYGSISKDRRPSVGGTEHEKKDWEETSAKEALPTVGFGGSSKNDSAGREVVPIPDHPPFTAHIGNLNFEIQTQDISDFFSNCDMKTVKLVRDKLSDRPKGFGYVEFNTKEGLAAAMELNGEKVCGRYIKISVARPQKPPQVAIDRPTAGGWRSAAPAHPELPAAPPIVGLSAVVRALEESGGRWRPNAVEKPPVGRDGGWRAASDRDSPPKEKPSKKWDCVSCGVSVDLDQKLAHLGGSAHGRLKKHQQQQQQQQQSPEGGTAFWKAGRRRSSSVRDQTAEDENTDPWSKFPNDTSSVDDDWES